MNNKNIHVGFDLDGVIADWVGAYTTYSNKKNGTQILKAEDSGIAKFSMYPWYQDKDEFIDTFMSWAKEPLAFVNIPDVSIENTIEANKMNRNFETTYITARNPPIGDVYNQTREWLDKRGLTGKLFVSKNKGLLCKNFGIDFYIDDKPSNLEMISNESPDTVPVLMKRSYQSLRDQQRFSTVSSVKEYHNLIRSRIK